MIRAAWILTGIIIAAATLSQDEDEYRVGFLAGVGVTICFLFGLGFV
jgi:hypothetical protein